jgi:adenosyl cobinamide kinase/adenosyl cobinamide phosphate guanylyltransferase
MAGLTLVLGGARSGKSAYAERLLLHRDGEVTYVATMHADASDADLLARLAAHRARRPSTWRTIEAEVDLPAQLRPIAGAVLIDSLGPWVAGQPDFAVDGAGLCAALADRLGDTVVVSEEVGLGVHPATEVGRAFRDALGTLNQMVAEVATEVLLVVAGRALPLHQAP